MKKERYQKKKGILLISTPNARKEMDFELDYLLSLNLNERISMMEAKSRELKSLLAENGHRAPSAIIKNKAAFVIIGATALPVYGYARATLDIDLFIKPELDNISRVIKALKEFGYDLRDLTPKDFLKNKILIRQYPVEADIHPFVKGVSFDEVWKNRGLFSFSG